MVRVNTNSSFINTSKIIHETEVKATKLAEQLAVVED